jgi:hypothetical protein
MMTPEQRAEMAKRLIQSAELEEGSADFYGSHTLAKLLREAAAVITGSDRDLAKFAILVLEESRDELTDLDGGWLQDTAEECGLLVRVEVTEPCGDVCQCAEYGDFPQECLRYPEEIKTLVDAMLKETKEKKPS